MRLLQFNETYKIWVSKQRVEELGIAGEQFFDITDFQDLEVGPVPAAFIPSRPTHQAIVEPLLPRLVAQNIIDQVTRLSAYTTRYYTSPTGEEAANYLVSEYQKYSAGRNDISVNRFKHSWRQDSIIAKIHGTGPSANEVVIIGGHIDSTSSGARAPGADDDASGSSTVLEVFRVLAASGFKPERTLEFHGYAAEEVGLLGSQAIANAYKQQGVVVAGMMQLDMTGYVRDGTTPSIIVITDFTNAQLNAFIRALVEAYTDLSWTNDACGYACSDHASWNRAGYAACFPFEALNRNLNPYIHTVNDVVGRLNLNHVGQFAKLGLGYAVEMSFAE